MNTLKNVHNSATRYTLESDYLRQTLTSDETTTLTRGIQLKYLKGLRLSYINLTLIHQL